MRSKNQLKNMRGRLFIIQTLIFALPVLVLSFVFCQSSFKLEFTHVLLLSLSLIFMLAGMIITRQIFDKISFVAVWLKEADAGALGECEIHKDITELQEISGAFKNIMNKLENTTGELNQKVFELLTLRELIESAKKNLSIDALLNLILEKSMAVIGAQVGSVMLIEPDSRKLRVISAKGHEKLERDLHISLEESLIKPVLIDGKSMLVEDIENDPRTLRANNPRYGAPSFLSMPIFIGNSISAVLNMANKKTAEPFDLKDEQIISIMLGEIGFALENALLHSRLEEHLNTIKQHNIRLEEEIENSSRLNKELIEKEKKYRQLVENSNDIIYSVNLEGEFVYVNPVAERVCGYPQEELVGMHFLNLVPPEAREELRVHYDKQFRGGIANTYCEFPLMVRDGSAVWIGQNVQTLVENGIVSGFQAVARDITKQKTMEQQLRESEQRYKELADSLPQTVFEADELGFLTFVNQPAFAYWGYSKEDIENGFHLLRIIAPEDMEKAIRNIQRLREGKETGDHEYRAQKKDGSTCYVAIHVNPIVKNGKTVGSRGVVIDVTETRRASEELKKAYQNLQETKDQLIQAEKLAAVGRLSAGVAHEILNPVNIISMELQMMKSGECGPETLSEDLGVCMDQLARIVTITENLKQFSRMPGSKVMTHDLKGLVEHVLKLCAAQFRLENVSVSVQHDSKLPTISLDRDKIEQVLLNLITNALFAMEGRAEKILRILTEVVPNGDLGSIRLTIADNGTGIDEGHMSSLFDPFYTTKEPGKGTGLGLFISYGIIRDHGGKIWAENNEWGGASFCIDLPLKTAAEEKIDGKGSDRR